MSIGIISSLPISIRKEKMIFEKYENSEKFPIGPIEPKAGPILLMQDTVDVKFASRSNPSSEISTNPIKRISI